MHAIGIATLHATGPTGHIGFRRRASFQ
jgi:hypothetical protein